MTNDERILLTVAVLGGTGKEGSGLAIRWALNGYRVIIGSRDGARAQARAAELNGGTERADRRGLSGRHGKQPGRARGQSDRAARAV